MTTMELFAIAAGMAGIAEKIDELSDSFDIDFTDSDIRGAIECVQRAEGIGESVWLMFVEKLEDKLQNEYPNFDTDKFGWYLNGRDTHIYYDGQELYSANSFEDFFSE
ncbi:hypothetical protein [Bacteroides pyogenes]|uniref:hypothetical protein n=1 Tax=Bacteroides pyogenes TaxID=310300 RepID=UPI002FD98322